MQLSELQRIGKYSTLYVAKVLGIDRERLRAWLLKEYFEPTLPSLGRGTRIGFSRSDIYGIALFKLLVEIGIKREIVSQLVGKWIGSTEVGMGPDDAGMFGKSTYFMYGKVMRGGEEEYFSRFHIDGSGQGIMNMGLYPDKLQMEKLPADMVGNWSYINIVNLAQIRQEIDEAMAIEG